MTSTQAEQIDEVQRLLTVCRAKPEIYTRREVEFLRSIGGAVRRPLTAAQTEWLQKLAEREPINFDEVNRRALTVLTALCKRWLPDGDLRGREYTARNPLRSDTKAGSFRINVDTGKWADFAQPDARGGDPISLAAYLHCGWDQIEGALSLKRMLGL
jgi:hypothetical protein